MSPEKRISIVSTIFLVISAISAIPFLVILYMSFAFGKLDTLFTFDGVMNFPFIALLLIFLIPLLTGVYLSKHSRWAYILAILQGVFFVAYGLYDFWTVRTVWDIFASVFVIMGITIVFLLTGKGTKGLLFPIAIPAPKPPQL